MPSQAAQSADEFANDAKEARGAGSLKQTFELGGKGIEDEALDLCTRACRAGFLAAVLPDARESRLADISKRMGVKSNYIAKYKSRLLAEDGVD